jgi:hypothetical protein
MIPLPSPETMFHFDLIALAAILSWLAYDIHYAPWEGPIGRAWRKWRER